MVFGNMTPSPGYSGPRSLFVLVFLLVVSVVPAFAYINPGAGGMLVQLVIGGVIAGVVLLRAYWQRLRAWLPGGRSRSRDEDRR